MWFKDRMDAGQQLAAKLAVAEPTNAVVLALPRGGIPLGVAIADHLGTPLDVILAKKIGHPLYSEFAIGAVAEDGEPILNETIPIEADWLKQEVARIRREIERRRQLYSQVLAKQPLKDKDVIIVDDGIATGMTMFAAIEAAQAEQPRTITVAVPIIPKDTFEQLKAVVDEVVYVEVPDEFAGSVGAYYAHFPQVKDSEVQDMLLAQNQVNEDS